MALNASHATYDAHYHIVFPVKYRRAIAIDGFTRAIADITAEIGKRYDIDFEAVGFDLDHIHLLCSFSPAQYKGGDVVRIYKSLTAKQLFARFPQLRKQLWGGSLWSAGYYFATVSERGNWAVVEKYVKNQGQAGKTVGPLTQLSLLT
jgi:putative transposase